MSRSLLIAASMIFAVGLVMIFSTTSAEVLDHDLQRSTSQAMFRQVLYGAAGLGLAIFVQRIGYRDLIRAAPILMFFFSILLVLVLIPGVGREVNGAKRWLGVAGLSFQPSEFVKYVVPAYFIYRYLKWEEEIVPLKEFLKWIGVSFIPIFLIMVEPNNGTAGVVLIALIALVALTRIPAKYWVIPLLTACIVGGISATQSSYISGRLKVYLNPELDVWGKGHQPLQAKIAAGSGQFFGKGPGNSLQKLSYLPEAQNDYIAAIYAEEFGFLGVCFLITLYLIIAYLGFAIAYQCSDPYGFYLAAVVTFLISFQAFMNMGVVSGLLPSTGLNLPFFSQGGSSLMANIVGVALLININQRQARECVV